MEQSHNNAPRAEEEPVIIVNCCYCHPHNSPERRALQASLKPNELISDTICPTCTEKNFGDLAD
jgi:hypothetical protein